MKLLIVSHKPCWRSAESPSGFATDGGFPFQVETLSELFESTEILVPVTNKTAPPGTMPLKGWNLKISPLKQPRGQGFSRKIGLIFWLPGNFPSIWRAVKRAEAVHTPIPGDVGFFAALAALAQKKPLFIRYCGRWGYAPRLTKRLIFLFLEKIAGGRNIVLATGGGEQPPSSRNPNIQWIFSTSLCRAEMEAIPARNPWRQGERLRLISVARQEPGKNTDLIIQALALLKEKGKEIELTIVGGGSELPRLMKLAWELKLENKVEFRGHLNHNDVMRALYQAHIFCFPTRSEGFPKAALEALACGLPLITTPVSVLPKLVGEDCGILLRDVSPQGIAEAVLGLLEDETRFQKMQISAQARAKEYTLEKWREEIKKRLDFAWGSLKK